MSARPPYRRWVVPAAIVGGWAVIGLASAGLRYGSWRAEQIDVSLGRALALTLPYWLFWPLVTPAIVWVARRAPLTPGRWPHGLSAHLVAGVAIGAVHAALYIWAHRLWFPFPSSEPVPAFIDMYSSYLRNRWQLELLLYATILAVVVAMSYYREGQQRAMRTSQLETQLAQAQLQALRMQLHPHFLFNTLQAISVLTVEDPRAAQRMLVQLGDLLRGVLDGAEHQEVPLRDELDFLRRYLEIEQVRFPDRLSVRYDVDEGALDAMVPSFVLQPLVENAIRYAITPVARPGLIELAASIADSRLRLLVRDSGPGFPARIDEGLGISTTRARLEKLYGPQQRLTLGHAAGGGAEAVIELPLRFEADADGE